MRFLLIIMALSFCPTVLFCQEEKEYRLDAYFQVTAKKDYKFRRTITKQDSVWLCKDFDRQDRLAQQASYTDERLKTLTGYYAYYVNGKIHYEGFYKNSKPAGTWYFYEPYGKLADSLNYDFYNKISLATSKAGNLRSPTDSAKLADTAAGRRKDTSGIFQRVEKDAEFPGGSTNWRKFLERNLLPEKNMPDILYSYSGGLKGTVNVRFIVCTDGQICNVETLTSVHPLVDWYAVRTIRKGPNWTPAEQNNRKVKAYHTQPVTFIFEEE